MRLYGSVRIAYPRWTRGALIRYLRERLPSLAARLPLVRVVLFGSYARGRATAASDVDLLVVYAPPPRDDAYALVRKTLEVPGLEPHLYTTDEFASNASALSRMITGGVVLMDQNTSGSPAPDSLPHPPR